MNFKENVNFEQKSEFHTFDQCSTNNDPGGQEAKDQFPMHGPKIGPIMYIWVQTKHVWVEIILWRWHGRIRVCRVTVFWTDIFDTSWPRQDFLHSSKHVVDCPCYDHVVVDGDQECDHEHCKSKTLELWILYLGKYSHSARFARFWEKISDRRKIWSRNFSCMKTIQKKKKFKKIFKKEKIANFFFPIFRIFKRELTLRF